MANDRPLFRGPFNRPAEAVAEDPETTAWRDNVDKAVPASALNQADKNAIWRQLKATGQDAFFQDPTVKALMAAGAVPAFSPELVREARKQATKVTE